MKNYRTTKDVEQIFFHLEEVKEKKAAITLWQNIDDVRTVSKGLLLSINKENGVLLLDPLDQIHLSFKKEVSVFVKIDFQCNILFKGVLHGGFKNLLAISLPEECHLMEYRVNNRRRLRLSPQNYIVAFGLNPLQPVPVRFKLAILDVSPTGASLLADSDQVLVLKSGSRISIRQLANELLEKPLMATIVYVLPMNVAFKIKNLSSFRLGVHFDEIIPDEYFHYFEV